MIEPPSRPDLRSGFSTGTCAAAAAKAAVMLLCQKQAPKEVVVSLPNGGEARFSVLTSGFENGEAFASVRKDAGDDPDITHGLAIFAYVVVEETGDIRFLAGEGVGTVTKRGLSIPPGEPAINPVPRSMIRHSLREITSSPLRVTIAIPGGEELAKKTFNPRLGIVGGLSVLGTTGIVRPFSAPALQASLVCALDVAVAAGIRAPVLVPGNIGERAARKLLKVADEEIVQVSNHWGFMLDEAAKRPFDRVLVMGHPGKLAKLIDGEWDTHSSSSASAVETVKRIAGELLTETDFTTVEGIFTSLSPVSASVLGCRLASAIREVVRARLDKPMEISVALINMSCELLGSKGEMASWN